MSIENYEGASEQPQSPVMAPNRITDESDACMRKRLVDSLSQSFPGSALSLALQIMEPDDSPDPLSSSCFAELSLEKGPLEEDEELTSLAWLQDSDLLKNIGGEDALCPSPLDDVKENESKTENPYSPPVPYNPRKHINNKPPYSFSCLIFMAIEDSPSKKLPVKDIYNWILTHFPYFQNAPTGWKNSVRHNLSLNKCFKKVDKEKGHSIGKGSLWMIDPDYRPNLLQALRKTPYNPYHQLQMLVSPQSLSGCSVVSGVRPSPLTPQKTNVNTPSPHLFPFLSKRLAQSKIEDTDIDVANTLVSLKRAAESARGRTQSRDSLSQSRSPSPPEFGSAREKEILRRKRRLKRRRKAPVVITCHPSSDHSYSMTSLPGCPSSPGSSSIDEEYDFGSESFSETSAESDFDSDEGNDSMGPASKRRRLNGNICASIAQGRITITEADEDEQKKIVEGADALLNLAGIRTPLSSSFSSSSVRSLSPTNNNNNNNTIKQEVEDSTA